jgi:hypothetical protein
MNREALEQKAKEDGRFAIAAAILTLCDTIETNLRMIGWGTLSPTKDPGCLEKIAMVMEDISGHLGEANNLKHDD